MCKDCSFLVLNPFSIFHPGPTGLNWDKLNESLNPEFDWEAAVQKALGTDDTLEEV